MPSKPPPPRRGFAIRDPAPPKLSPRGLGSDVDEEERPLVEPDLAASRRSLTAVSWASNLSGRGQHDVLHSKIVKM